MALQNALPLLKVIRPINPDILQLGKVLEVKGPVLVIVESKRGIDLDVDGSLLDAAEGAAHETIVPKIVFGNQEVAADTVTEQQLALHTHAGGEALGLVRGHV